MNTHRNDPESEQNTEASAMNARYIGGLQLQAKAERDRDAACIAQMASRGGGFVKALARACMAADADNLNRIKTAFPEVWKFYTAEAEREANP